MTRCFSGLAAVAEYMRLVLGCVAIAPDLNACASLFLPGRSPLYAPALIVWLRQTRGSASICRAVALLVDQFRGCATSAEIAGGSVGFRVRLHGVGASR